MKRWKISQDFNERPDAYDCLVVAAETEEEAKLPEVDSEAWAPPEHVTVEYLCEEEEGTPAGIIVGTYHGGGIRWTKNS
jgi:hypothetical protein